jgi:chromate transporter
MIYLLLFFEFLKIGMFSVGGGLATLPFLYNIIEKYRWISQDDLLNMIAVAESTPGPIGINTATFVGFKTGHILGGVIATLGIVIPAIIIISIISHYFTRFSEMNIVRAGFDGVRPAVVGLIAAAGFEVVRIALLHIDIFSETGKLMDLLNYKAIALFVIMFLAMNRFKKHPIFYIFIAGVIGIVFKY